jgi:hypothetical protein
MSSKLSTLAVNERSIWCTRAEGPLGDGRRALTTGMQVPLLCSPTNAWWGRPVSDHGQRLCRRVRPAVRALLRPFPTGTE